MKAKIVAALVVFLAVAASPALPMELAGSWAVDGSQKTYTYILTNSEFDDIVTSVHVYAPLALGLIQGQTGPENWSSGAVLDLDPEVGADIYWYADDYDLYSIPDGGQATFTLTVPSWTDNVDDYVVPGCWANWGFEIVSWPDSVVVWFDSVPVPVGTMAQAPEVGGFTALAVGCIALVTARCIRRPRTHILP